MTWLNPLALVGLLAVAVPVLVHLFGRRRARTQRFPSLRLLTEARPTPTTRSRPSDMILLLVRSAIVIAAVAALAQPRWSTAARARIAQTPTRAIIVDTSESMRRLMDGGKSAAEEARVLARRLSDSSRAVLVVESNRPGADATGAASWLSLHSGVRELVVISDFQQGAVADGDLTRVPLETGLRFMRVNAIGAMAQDTDSRVEVDALPGRTDATWRESSGTPDSLITIFAADSEQAAVSAALALARETAGVASDGRRRLLIAFPHAADRAALVASAIPLDSAWQGNALLFLRSDVVLSAIAASAPASSCEQRGVPIAPDASGQGIAQVAGSNRAPGALLVLSCVDPSSLAGAALIARSVAAMSGTAPGAELEPLVVPDEQLRRWERTGAESPSSTAGEASPDGRWFWVIALLLLLVEEWLRRRQGRQGQAVTEERRARVA